MMFVGLAQKAKNGDASAEEALECPSVL